MMQSTTKMCIHCTNTLPDLQSLVISTKANSPSVDPTQLAKGMQSTTKTSSNSAISDIDPRKLVIRPKADSPFASQSQLAKAHCSDFDELIVLKDQLRKLWEQFKKATDEDEKTNISMRMYEMIDSYEKVDTAGESKEDSKPKEIDVVAQAIVQEGWFPVVTVRV
ncbi:hypothetical protein BDV97DRAFT_372423 [Delphinella strobiligena]|nr:hypothetical protein BDV97DRAFT_372423 [Delphinella strobiligena]